MIPQLALHLLAGLTPPEHEVKIVEEEIEDVNFDEECDLVGISCMTANAPRAYRFAFEFRKRRKKVVLGGIHPTILPDEAMQHADAVVIGEAEGVWEQLLEDVK
ncbi:MAG TPA: cobalamin-dependent protein, partial [candidate division Zixibacteria bacterium]|nr:cobalamin-dependent protein [candidate division Zixibacteria bacterium]